MRVAVVGGGIAGLSCAHRLTELDPSIDVVVLEASERTGGILRSEVTPDGFVIEHGPDAILTEKPAALALARRVGLESEIVRTRESPRGAYVVCRGRLERVPEGFALVAPVDVAEFLRSPIVSWRGKVRAALDLVLPRGPDRDDESLGDFVRRRFGAEVLERLAQPLAGGVYGADPDRLSLRATMPRFLDAERERRSVVLGLREKQKARAARSGSDGAVTAATGVRYGLFISFRRGVQMLPDAVASRLGERVRTRSRVEALERTASGFRLAITGSAPVDADAVVLALPAVAIASLLRPHDAELASMLEAIPHGSAAATTFAWPRAQIPHPLDAFGFVVPEIEARDVIASTWASVKWPGRAPDGMVLIRVFLGGPRHDEVVTWSDDALIAASLREMSRLMGITAPPSLTRVDRYVRAMPRYEVGHLRRVERIEERARTIPALALAGTAFRGVGVPDAVKGGETAAERIFESLARRL